jgi:RNAse (barnase) inhibitor barstar
MEHGDFHGFMKDYMEKTCPTKEGDYWCTFTEELKKYRDLSKALKMCGYYSANLDCKIDEISKNVKELKDLAKESKQKFSDISTKERVEHSFKTWLYGLSTVGSPSSRF